MARRRAAAYDDLFAAQQNMDRARSLGLPIPRVRPDRVGRVGGESSIRDASKTVAARLHLSPRSPPAGVPPRQDDLVDDDGDVDDDDEDTSPSPMDPVLRPRPPLLPPPGHVRQRVQAWERGRQQYKPNPQYKRSSSMEAQLGRVQSTVDEYERRAASSSRGGKGSKGGSRGDRRRFRDVRDGWQPTMVRATAA